MLQTTVQNPRLEAHAVNDKALTQNSQFAQTLDTTNARNLSDQEFFVSANIADTIVGEEVTEAVELEKIEPDASAKSPIDRPGGNTLPLSGQSLPSMLAEGDYQPLNFYPPQLPSPENQQSIVSGRPVDVEVFSEAPPLSAKSAGTEVSEVLPEQPLHQEVTPDSERVESHVLRGGDDRLKPFEGGTPIQTDWRNTLSQARYPDRRGEAGEAPANVVPARPLQVGMTAEGSLPPGHLPMPARLPSDVVDTLTQTHSHVAAKLASDAATQNQIPPEAMIRVQISGLPQGEKSGASPTSQVVAPLGTPDQVLRAGTSGDVQAIQSPAAPTTGERNTMPLMTNPSQSLQPISVPPARTESPVPTVGVDALNGGVKSPTSSVKESTQTVAAALGLRTKTVRGAYEGSRVMQQTVTPSSDQASLVEAPADTKLASEGADRPNTLLARIEMGIADTQRASGSINTPIVQAPTRETGEAVNEQIMRAMGRQALAHGRFTLQLNPRELGALDVEFSTERGELKIAVIAREAHTRELLDTNINRLRQSLQEAGITVGDLDVRQERKGGENSSDASARHHQNQVSEFSGPSVEPSAVPQIHRESDTLFDIYV